MAMSHIRWLPTDVDSQRHRLLVKRRMHGVTSSFICGLCDASHTVVVDVAVMKHRRKSEVVEERGRIRAAPSVL
jgi:hypothetical protein